MIEEDRGIRPTPKSVKETKTKHVRIVARSRARKLELEKKADEIKRLGRIDGYLDDDGVGADQEWSAGQTTTEQRLAEVARDAKRRPDPPPEDSPPVNLSGPAGDSGKYAATLSVRAGTRTIVASLTADDLRRLIRDISTKLQENGEGLA